MKGTAYTGIDRRALICGMTVASALGGVLSTAVQAQTAAPSGGFSFAACGDSRPMMYLPYKDGRPDLVKLFVVFDRLLLVRLVLPRALPSGGPSIKHQRYQTYTAHRA
jgi:hypothetical protein